MIVLAERLTPGTIDTHWIAPMPSAVRQVISSTLCCHGMPRDALDDEDQHAADDQRHRYHHRRDPRRLPAPRRIAP